MKTILFSLFLFALSMVYAILPDKYLGPEFSVKGKPKVLVQKTYEALDKFNDIDLGYLVELTIVIRYNEKGNPLKISEIDSKGDVRTIYSLEYDAAGNVKNINRYDGSDKLDRYCTISYKDEKKAEEKVYGAEGNLQYTEVFSYNANGQLNEKKRVQPDGRESIKTLYTYNADRTLAKETKSSEMKKDGIISEREYQYDKKGRVQSETNLNASHVIDSKKEFIYNENGDITEENTVFAKKANQSKSYRFQYDSQGNWTRRVNYVQQYIPTVVNMRKVEY